MLLTSKALYATLLLGMTLACQRQSLFESMEWIDPFNDSPSRFQGLEPAIVAITDQFVYLLSLWLPPPPHRGRDSGLFLQSLLLPIIWSICCPSVHRPFLKEVGTAGFEYLFHRSFVEVGDTRFASPKRVRQVCFYEAHWCYWPRCDTLWADSFLPLCYW